MMPERPNILIIMSDDQGPWALGCAGTSELRTPNLDALAAGGTRFSHMFCVSPVCSPARASFLTGRIPSQHGVHDWLMSGNIAVPAGATWSGADQPIEYLAGLTGFTDLLADAGYRCGFAGKWHLGDSARPQKGHTWWHAYALGGGDYYRWHGFDNSPELSLKTQYVTDYYTDRALEFLDPYGADEQPWCLSLNYTAPHAPWGREQHPAEIYDSYADCDFASLPVEPPHPWGGWNPTPEQRRATAQGYFAAVTAMDSQIGRVLARSAARDNTLVVFTGDNGFNVGHHGLCGKGNASWPLNMYEESVRVPFIVWRPGHVPAGVVHDGLCSHYDWLPTLADYLGLSLPAGAELPGRSFAPVLGGQADGGAEEVVICDEYGPARMIRDRQWKYVHRWPDGPHELYHLPSDPGERRNLADEPSRRAEVERLRGRLAAWFERFVQPGRDGQREAVTGSGQTDWCRRPGAYRERRPQT